MDKKNTIIGILIIGITLCLIFLWGLPEYKEDIQEEARIELALTQSTQGILFYPVIQKSDNQTILQSITWQELCQNLGG